MRLSRSFSATHKGSHATMKKDTVVELRRPAQEQDLLSTMLRDGAQRLVAQDVQAEFEEFLARFSDDRVEDGRSMVVRNGFQPEQERTLKLTAPGHSYMAPN